MSDRDGYPVSDAAEPRADGGFEAVDWEAEAPARGPSPTLVLRLVPFVALAGLYVYDTYTDNGALVAGWYPTMFDWLSMFAVLVFAVGFVWPLVARPAGARRYWRRLRGDRAALAALAVVLFVVLVALVQPLAIGRPRAELLHGHQPPVFTTTDVYPCVGGDDIDRCPGTWQHPLGTNRVGQDMVEALAASINVSVRFAFIVAALVIPLAVLVGTLSGYLGGRVDDVLMRYVDLQQTVPAFLVYIIVGYLTQYTLFNIAVVFGLFSWGNVARLVRSEVLQRKQAAYVTAARNAGAGHLRVIRRHVLPNVSGTVLTGVTLQIPTLILAEAALAFLAFGDIDRMSFGTLIRQGLGIPAWNTGATSVTGVAITTRWWVALFPVLAIVVMVVAFNVLGDQLRDATDPRGRA